MDSTVDLTAGQKNALMITERVVSIFSILGIFFILVTFYFLSSFNKPINRLVFYASFGNLGMNIACLISEDGINAGPLSPLCQFQAFLIQMYGAPPGEAFLCVRWGWLTVQPQVLGCRCLLVLLHGVERLSGFLPQVYRPPASFFGQVVSLGLLRGLVCTCSYFPFRVDPETWEDLWTS